MAKNLDIKLHLIKKLQLWRAVKKEVLNKMDSNAITPERADQILTEIKEQIIGINSTEQVEKLSLVLLQVYPELLPLRGKFERKEAESFDKLLTLFLDVIMEKGEIDLANRIMEEIENSKDHNKFAQELQKKYPVEFQICLKRLQKLL